MESILSSQKLAKKMQQELGQKQEEHLELSISILKIKSFINRPFLSVLQLVASLNRERFFTML